MTKKNTSTTKMAKKKTTIVRCAEKSPFKDDFIQRTPPGYQNHRGVILPVDIKPELVSTSKIKVGLKKAQDEIKGMIQNIVDTMIGDYSIKEIELMASFSADGKFLGIGVGGATSIKITIAPDKK